MQLDSTLSATARPFQPRAVPQSSQEDDALGPTLFDMDWQGVVLLWVLLLTHPWKGHSPVTANPLTTMGYPLILPSQEDVRKRMDFQVKSRSPNSEARRATLMMWLAPSGSGPAASPTIVITMRIRTSCPW